MAEHINVYIDQASRLISVSYSGDEPQRSAEIANTLVEQYMTASAEIVSDPAQNRQARYAEFLDTCARTSTMLRIW